MEIKDELIEKLAEPVIEETKEQISEKERKRYSLPKIKLSEIELEFIRGLAEGRDKRELDTAIRLYTKEKFTYNSMKNHLLDKFEAFTPTHIVFKALEMGFLQDATRSRCDCASR